MASEEFNPVALARIIEDALGTSNTVKASFVDTAVIEKLHEVLPKYMDPSDAIYVISKVREELYSGFSVPTAENLHSVIARCVKCKDNLQPNPTLPQWNRSDPDLLIVAANPSVIFPYKDILQNALKKAGFNANRVCLTFVTRCETKSNETILKCMSNCAKFLHSEVHALKPKLILTLGLPAYIGLTGNDSLKMKDLPDRVHYYGIYPVLSTIALGAVAYGLKSDNPGILSSFEEQIKLAHEFLYRDKA